MQKLAEICIRRPVFAAMIIMALVVVGVASYLRLGVDRFPSVDLPTVSVRTILPGASPEEIETEVSQRIEEVVNTVEGIQELRSISVQGMSIVIVTFSLDRDIDVAAQDVRDRVATVVRDLPRDADPPIISKFNNDSSPVMSIALSANRSLRELTELADKVVKIQLERSAGVGDVFIVGGLSRAINVWVDADRLAAYQIPITAVRNAIVRQNADVPGGNVTAGAHEQVLRTMGRIVDPKGFNDLVIATVNGAPVRVRDIGWAEDGTKEQRSVARLNGVPTVTLEVRRQSGANTVEVIEGVKAKLAQIAPQLPADVKLEVIRDQSRYIYNALHEINLHLILGSILASLVVLVFMRSWRSTLIAAVAIPTSVVSTFGMMRALNFTLNSVTMLALVLMVGVVIDDAIVVLENIFRFVEEKRMRPFEAARAATAEIGLAVMATTLSLVVIFIPVSFMSSISGRFLYQFGITAAVAVMVSLLVSFTLTPMMSARLLRSEDAAGGHGVAKSRRGFYALLDRNYERILAMAMRHRAVVATLALGVIISAVPLYRGVRQDYIPSDVDEAEFDVNVTAREGVSLAAMDEVMRAIEAEVRSTPGVRLVLATAGSNGFLNNVNSGTMYVRIAPHEERTITPARIWRGILHGDPLEAFRGNYSQRDVMQEIRNRLRKYRDLRTAVRNAPSFNIGGGNFDIDFVLRGPDLQALANYAEQLRQKSQQLGIIDADTTLKLDKPELRVEIDRERAADLGVSTDDIATALRLMVGGDQRVSRFHDPSVNDDYDVQLRLSEPDRNNLNSISRLYVPRQNGQLVRLDNLVRIVPAQTASRIDRLDRQRQVSLRAQVAPGYGLADRLEVLRNAVKEMNLPPGYTTSVSGRGRELERTFREFVWAFLLSIIFMYMILASQFESLVHPLTILLSLPLSIPFALLSLWLTSNTLNLYSALGILVLFGVVKKNAILQIDHMNNLRREGMERTAAILQANRDRLRPILMTTLALVAGMLPLALGSGPGAEERRAIAVVVIGGQSLSLLLTLIVTPVAYSLFDDLGATEAWQALASRLALFVKPITNVTRYTFARLRRGVAAGRSVREQNLAAGGQSAPAAATEDELEQVGARGGD
jgi:HAE1 family hydrophobic/amphiphilic exporter-1